MSGKMRLLLVDDHNVMRAGLRTLFEREADMEVVAESSSAADALNRAAAVEPDVIVLDLTMPGGGSLDLIRMLRGLQRAPQVLILTMHDDPAYARSALAIGASGYVVKTISEQELIAAVRAIGQGKMVVDLDDQALTASVFGPAGLVQAKGRRPAFGQLSKRELEVLRLLGKGHANLAIAAHLDVSPKTVATYRARIGEKLGLKSTADFVRYVTETGLMTSQDSLP